MHMRTTSHKKSSKKIALIIVVSALLLIGGGATVYALTSKQGDSNIHSETETSTDSTPTINTDKPTNEQVQAGNEAKDNTVNQDQGNEQTGSLSASITYTQVANQNVKVGVVIDSLISSGTCTFSATRSGASTVTKTASVQALNSSSTCEGFTIPTSEFIGSGEWMFTVKVESSDQSITLNGSFSI